MEELFPSLYHDKNRPRGLKTCPDTVVGQEFEPSPLCCAHVPILGFQKGIIMQEKSHGPLLAQGGWVEK